VRRKLSAIGLRDILEMSDAKAFVAGSGWHPGVRLTAPVKVSVKPGPSQSAFLEKSTLPPVSALCFD